ncbi:Glycosyltransferase involved in cell wall bisynthesis [Tessaracoccus bendigoensis DSM 12906]|uniref:Glycosyltransferase involved in cell wall bisynthesis n=1 Tax=Tessaracoccus bendigoensis DSM 12906 TaxID=1123357 RepID=A0A1M6NP90_9ACTN|nr:glycosyltransferase [Tessaracoccus bendigoensis]SHJ97561.1 Glycosyltransferase involved in cell wall bisynthesis [Tessaracoccus bendigoensis DSM 12906]
MRVAFISLHTSPAERAGTADAGGMNVLIRALAGALQKTGAQVEFFTRRSSPEQGDTVTLDDGLIVHHVTAGPMRPLPKSEIDAYIDEFRDNLGALDRFDVVHSHHWMSGVAALPLARAAGIPHVMTFHSVAAHPNASLHEGEPAETPARLAGEVTCATQSDLVITVSRHEAAVVIGRCQAEPERVVVVRPGVDTVLFHPADPGDPWVPAPGVTPGYLLFAARLQPLKAPDVAIGALAQLPEAGRPDLVIVGQASPDFADYEAELHRLAVASGVADKVFFLPGQGRDDFAETLRHASILLVPSYSETFGLVALEGSASGVPVVAAAEGGLTEAICNTHTGILVPTHDPGDWAKVIASLLADPARRAELATTGRRRAESMTWDHVAERTLAAYRKACTSGRRVAFLHAHPDDETLASGALIMHLIDEGLEVSVLTATRGEMGGVVPGPLTRLEGTPELQERREAELAGALAELGVRAHAYLGHPPARADSEPRRYLDSGMRWIEEGLAGPGDEADERSLTLSDLAEEVADAVEFLRYARAELVVSYDDDGGYGHPDHCRMHAVAKIAAADLGLPFAALTSSRELAAQWFRLDDLLPRVAKALRHHRTQLTVHDDGSTITHSGGQTEQILTSVGLRGSFPRLP